MIAFLKGNVVDIRENRVILEVGGIGYNVFVNGRDADRLHPSMENILLHTYLQVREDAMQLYGFISRDDLDVFRLLLGVNGVGPKAALGILSTLTANDLRFAVLAGDAKAISKAPGIGSKTAQKMILELKDKFDLQETFEDASAAGSIPASEDGRRNADEAVQALTALGYPSSDALKAVRSLEISDDMSTEDILKAALKKMAF